MISQSKTNTARISDY